MNSEPPVIALLGNVDHEGIVSVLKTSGYVYQKKILESGPENWVSIVKLLERPNVDAVLVKLTSSVYELLVDPHYEKLAEHLLTKVSKKRNLVFIYDALLAPIPDEYILDPDSELFEAESSSENHYSRYHDLPSAPVRALVNEKLRNASIEPVCYSTNAQLTVIGAQFLKDLAAKLLFRIYIPHGRLYATEIDKLLQLFKEFLDNTGREGITLNKVAAEHGASFEFCGEYDGQSSLSDDFQDFSQFMELCVSDVEKARTMLLLREIDGIKAIKIINRYTKEARRLYLDIRHEREMKVLEIRHRLEAELSETLSPSTKAEIIRALVDEAIPSVDGLGQIVLGTGHRMLPQKITFNVNSQVIEQVHGYVTKEIIGNTTLGVDADNLMSIIRTYGGDKATELSSDVHEIGDKGVPEGTRLTKKQRLKSFLYGLRPEVAKMGLHLMEEYIKSKIT